MCPLTAGGVFEAGQRCDRKKFPCPFLKAVEKDVSVWMRRALSVAGTVFRAYTRPNEDG